jgi:predicted nucleic acid-binding protein
MIVVADTSPINYLVSINEIALLPKLYGAVIIPPAVRDELSRDRAPGIVRRWIAAPPAWLEVRKPATEPDAELIAAELDAGELDAILLAQELGGKLSPDGTILAVGENVPSGTCEEIASGR